MPGGHKIPGDVSRAGEPSTELQRGCAEHVRILPGVPAIGCDVTSVVSGESREGEQEGAGSRQLAPGGRADGRVGGGNERTVSEPARADASQEQPRFLPSL